MSGQIEVSIYNQKLSIFKTFESLDKTSDFYAPVDPDSSNTMHTSIPASCQPGAGEAGGSLKMVAKKSNHEVPQGSINLDKLFMKYRYVEKVFVAVKSHQLLKSE